MSGQFLPQATAKLAFDVYEFSKQPNQYDAVNLLASRYKGLFNISEKNITHGLSGGPIFLKSKSCFALTLHGQGSLKNDAVIVFRGTAYLGDWLTNLNVGMSTTVTGQTVHDGFHMAFKSMLFELKQFSATLSEYHNVHCIGHSLGGGIATICAQWLTQHLPSKNVFLYTFGSPRPGTELFSRECTRSIRADRIFRCYHKTDVVPMIPFWPFFHTPYAAKDYYLPSPGSLPSAKYHAMSEYILSVGKNSWNTLGALHHPSINDHEIERWLELKPQPGLTVKTIEWLQRAMVYVIKRAGNLVGAMVTVSSVSYFTLLDQVSILLKKAIDLSTVVSGWLLLLVRKIMVALGMHRTVEAADITYTFLRNLFETLINRVNHEAQTAIDKVLLVKL